MPSNRVKYLKFKPESILAYLRSISPAAVPTDATVLPQIAYDRETGNVVCLVESAEFPEVLEPGGMTEIEIK